MLSADTALELRSLGATALDTIFHELAYTLGVDSLERICVQKLVSEIFAHECSYVIT